MLSGYILKCNNSVLKGLREGVVGNFIMEQFHCGISG